MLEDFCDIDDQEQCKKQIARVRRSLDMTAKRQPYLTNVKDVMPHRLEKDIMAASVSESMNGDQARGSAGFAGGRGMPKGAVGPGGKIVAGGQEIATQPIPAP
jgi:hypothetical protein